MLDAVYIDLLASRTIVGLLPKPAFYYLFESLTQEPDANVMVFNPNGSSEFTAVNQKESAPLIAGREMVALVETGESRTPRPEKAHPRYTTGLVGSLLSFGYPLPTEGNQTSRFFLSDPYRHPGHRTPTFLRLIPTR